MFTLLLLLPLPVLLERLSRCLCLRFFLSLLLRLRLELLLRRLLERSSLGTSSISQPISQPINQSINQSRIDGEHPQRTLNSTMESACASHVAFEM